MVYVARLATDDADQWAPVTCWCESTIVMVRMEDIRSGRTGTCGEYGCRPANQLALVAGMEYNGHMPRTKQTETTNGSKAAKRQPRACGCGCEAETRGGEFLPGHDARLKGQLLNKIRTGNARERTAAEKRLRDRGWEKFIPE